MAAQEKDARKENMNNMRKNRAYQELKREMDQKRRAREKVRLFKDNIGSTFRIGATITRF